MTSHQILTNPRLKESLKTLLAPYINEDKIQLDVVLELFVHLHENCDPCRVDVKLRKFLNPRKEQCKQLRIDFDAQ